MKNRVKRFTCLLVTLALVSGLFAGLAENSQPAEVDFTLDEVNIFGRGENVSSNASSSDIVEKDKKSSENTTKKLTASQKKNAKNLNKKIDDLQPVTGNFDLGGKTYYEFLSGTTEEKKKTMQTITSKDLFYKYLTTPTQGSGGKSDIFYSVWLPAASAVLQGGGLGKYYWVDDDWSPETFEDAFLKWYSRWCTRKSTPADFTDESYRDLESKTSKYHYAQSFKEVGEWMRQSVKDHSDYVYRGLTDNMDTYNNILAGWSAPNYKGDIFFVPYTTVIHRGIDGDKSSGHIGYAWDCFAVCFYDFKLKPISTKLKTAEEGSPSFYVGSSEVSDQSILLDKNKRADSATFSATKTDSVETTTTTTLSTEHSINYTESSNIEYSIGFGEQFLLGAAHSIKFGFNLDTAQTDTTSTEDVAGSTTTQSDTWTISGTLQPFTQARFTQSTATVEGAAAFNCPAEFQYKVAILSLCGDYSGLLPYRKVNVKHCGVCRIFGETNGDALADLESRVRKPAIDNFNMDFSRKDYYNYREADVLNNRLYVSVGGKNTFTIKQNISSAAVLTPLYPLEKTAVPADKASLTILYSPDLPARNRRLSLSSLPVEGYTYKAVGFTGKWAPYYGFSPELGEWKMVDKKGNVIESSEYAEIKSTPVGDFLVAKQFSGEPIYLQYFIEDGVYPWHPQIDDGKYRTNKDLKSRAMIEVRILDGGGSGSSGEVPIYMNKGKNPDALVYLDDEVWLSPNFVEKGWEITSMKSSKKSVAEVLRDGEVKLKKAGSAVITVKAKNGKKKITATVKLIVYKPGVPFGLQIDQGEKFTVGLKDKGIQLTATSLPNYVATDKVKWKSSKESVVKVDKNGVLIPVKTGTAKITATSKQNKKATATITIKVVKGKVANNGILDLEDDDATADTEEPASEIEAPAAEPKAPDLEVTFEGESVANETSETQEIAID